MYVGTILNSRKWMRRIREGRKTCEIKPRLTRLKAQYLVMKGNKVVRASRRYRYFLVARLLSRMPLGPFRTAQEVTAASQVEGQGFKTGMSEKKLGRLIQASVSQQVYIYRFEDAKVSTNVEWSNRGYNNNTGFLPMHNKKRNCVRFSVCEPKPEPVVVLSLPSRWKHTLNSQAAKPKPKPETARIPKLKPVYIDLTLCEPAVTTTMHVNE